jgi:imidazolonepropionase-like amidohydrolase
MDTKIFKGGTLIDGTGKSPILDSIVIVSGSRIESVGKNDEIDIPNAEAVEIIDAEGKTILPGLIDSHVHIGMGGESKDFYSIPIHNNSIDLAMKAIPRLRKTLEMGITTIRDGGSGYAWMEVALRNAINRGDILGPRYLTTGYHLTVTGGHGYFLPPWFGSSSSPLQIGMHCDGPDEWRKAARSNLYNGTDNVKVVASRGFLSAGLSGDAPAVAAQPSVHELKAAIDEAHKMGKKTIAHANGHQAIMNAINAGVDSIVHGFYMDEECAEMMVKSNVILEPTTRCLTLIRDFGTGEMLDTMIQKASRYCEVKESEFRMILDKGVTISFASDTGVPYEYHGENTHELASCVELGMSPMEAITAATKNAAYAVGLENQIGTLEAGKLADIIMVDGNPLESIEVLCAESKIKMVMKEGEVIITR